MNANLAHTLDSLFGPPSELIDISKFIKSSTVIEDFPPDEQNFSSDVVDQCSIEDLSTSLQEVWSNPTLAAYLIKDHEHTVNALHSLSQKSTKSARKTNLPDPDSLTTEVAKLQKDLDSVALTSFRLNSDAVLFMRTSKNSDQNILPELITSGGPQRPLEDHGAVLTISIHNKVPWGPSYVTRASQHAFLSSQTLHDVYTTIPCISKHLPPEARTPGRTGCAVCIEEFVYGLGDGGGDDYADKLLQQLEISNKKEGRTIEKAPTPLSNTPLCSLSIRTNEPYWLIHQGNCEHFLVIDQIRLKHPLDPCSGWPLTLQITPPILDLCRACGKVPAVWSVVGDVRLGESPCLLCGPCWRFMGPSDDTEVTVLPLPEYVFK